MNIISLFQRFQNPKFSSMGDMLNVTAAKEASGQYGKNPAALVIILDRDNDDYKTTYESAGMTAPQVIALLEVIKYRIMRERMKEPE